jgi:GNAT superfamily N-acetyltransferase
VHIRPAMPSDLPVLQDIEVQAGELFRGVGMDDIADAAPPSEEELADAAAVLVAVDDAGELVGYARIELVGEGAHLEQISVLPDHGSQGIGTALLDAVTAWARDRDFDAVTLTTFRDIPFNAPLYAKRGFVEVPGSAWPPAITALVEEEARHGLDPEQRVVMRRPAR